VDGWAEAVAELQYLPSIPYVPNATYAGGNDDIVLTNVQIGTRANQLINGHAFPLSLVSIGPLTLPAAGFFQAPGMPVANVRDFRSFLANEEEAALIEQEESLDENERRFTDAEYATDVWFHNVIAKGVIAYNPTFVLQKVRFQDLSMLGEEFNGEVDVTMRHFWLDLRFMDDQKPLNRFRVDPQAFPLSANTQYGVGAVVLLELSADDQVMRPVAIRVAMTKEDGSKSTQVFVRGECTDSAWIMALLAAACSYTQTGVGISHIFGYHVHAAAFQQHFFNNLDEGHSLRHMLGPMSKYTMQFDTAVLENTFAPLSLMPYYNANLSQFSSVLEGWNTLGQRFPYFSLLPSAILRRQGIRERDFTKNESWDLYPLVRFQLQVEQASRDFVSSFVQHLYTDNQSVRNDAQLQAFFEAIQDPSQGNIRATSSGRLSSVKDVQEFLLPYVYSNIVHGSARMRRYILSGTVIPNDIASFMSTEIVDAGPDAEYSMESILRSLPDTQVLFEQYKFSTFFQSTDNFGSLVTDSDDDLATMQTVQPYACSAFNEYFARLQHSVLDIYHEGYYAGFDDISDTISRWPINQEARRR
jgi:hypothetical protein